MVSTTDEELRQRIADLQRGGVRSPSVARQIQNLQQQLNVRAQTRTDARSSAAATSAPITAAPPLPPPPPPPPPPDYGYYGESFGPDGGGGGDNFAGEVNMATTDPRVQEFLNSPAYRAFQQSQQGMAGTMDMYDSPYFGSMSSGSKGRAQDAAYQNWLSQNYDASGNRIATSNPDPVTGAPVADPNTDTIDASQSTLSPNFSDYVYRMLARGEQAANLPFQSYTGQRFADTQPLLREAFRRYEGLTDPSQFAEATGIARLAAQRAGQMGYTPGQFTADRVSAPGLERFQMAQPQDVAAIRGEAARLGAAPTATGQTGIATTLGAAPTMEGVAAQAARLGAAPQMGAAQMRGPERLGFERVGAERISAPSLRDLQMQAAAPVSAERVGTRDLQAAQTGYRPDLRTFQMQAPSERVTSESFTAPGTAAGYMSPYLQQALAPQLREATRQADIARTGRQARFAQAGAFGGSRQAVEEAEAERNLQQRLADITGTGYQQAFGSAQEQFNREQAARQAAQQANIGTGLTVGQQNLAAQLGVQQLGTQTGLQTALANLTNEQQARVQSEANRLQAQGMNQQQALQAALANQQTQQQANVQNLSAALQTQGLGAQTGMEAQRLNQATGLQALLANQQAGMQTGQFNVQQQQQAALQNAQMEQQARANNMQMLSQYGLKGAELEQQANMLTAQQMQQARAANQQMFGQYGLQQGQLSQQMGLANLANQQAAEMANQQMRGQYGLQQGQFEQAMAQMYPQQYLQAQLANQQAGLTTGQQNLQALLGVQQLGAGQNLQAQLANQQQGLEAQRLGEQSRQFGAGYGMQGLQQQLAAGQLMSGIGAQAGQFGLSGLAGMLGAGGQQQTLAQQPFDFGYQQFQQSQQYPFQQATYMQSLLGGLPLQAAPYNPGTSGFGGALQGLALGAALAGGFK